MRRWARDQSDGGPAADPTAAVELAVAGALASAGRVVLAVSGGRDSMALLHAAARIAPARVALVATFDHGTGAAAAEAAALVERVGGAAGFPVALGRAARPAAGEAGWRAARWAFLNEVSRAAGAAVATAHTADDQVETVFMRGLRAAGPRGLAGLAAVGEVVRPLVAIARADVARYAALHRVPWTGDPTNASRRHLRNRVRLDLLPAVLRARPGFAAELLALGRRAASWRAEVEALAATLGDVNPARSELVVPADALAGIPPDGLAILWPALAARVGVTLDRRGTQRLSGFTTSGRTGGSIPLSGGAELRHRGDRFVLRRRTADIDSVAPAPQRLGPHAIHGRFRFTRRVAGGTASGGGAPESPWVAEFDRDAALVVRAWCPGDRMAVGTDGRARRVKRYFADARVPAFDRPGWPVVLADGAIAWIPGVRRSDAATVRPGRPAVRYECDRNDG